MTVGRIASISGRPLCCSHLLSTRCFRSTTFAISSLHQQFTCVHLFNSHLTLYGAFSLSVHYLNLTVLAAQGGLATPSCTVLPMSQLFIIFKRTSWHKQRRRDARYFWFLRASASWRLWYLNHTVLKSKIINQQSSII